MLPKDNELSATTYEAKQLVCSLGLEVQKIHACSVCGALRYKIRRDDPGEVEGEHPRKRVSARSCGTLL
jgi:hypothetical protein